jgi:hypothetical protein
MRVLIAAGCMVWIVLACGAQPPPAEVLQTQGPAKLRAGLSFENGRATLAFTDQITLIIEVDGDETLQVKSPKEWVAEPWRASRVGPVRETRGEGRLGWSRTIWVEPLAPGEHVLQLEPLQIRERGGDWRTIAWKPLTIRVSARLVDVDLAKLRDITSIEEVPGPADEARWTWIIAGTAAALVLAGVVGWLWRRRAAGSSRSAESLALRELERLEGLGLPERGKGERFGALLTALLRRYLERRFDVPARRQTTVEFLATIGQVPALKSEAAWMEDFLTRCDQIKFAPIETTQAECAALAMQVRDFLTRGGPATPVGLSGR